MSTKQIIVDAVSYGQLLEDFRLIASEEINKAIIKMLSQQTVSDDLLSCKALQEKYNISYAKLYGMMKRCEIKFHRSGRKLFFKASEFEESMNQGAKAIFTGARGRKKKTVQNSAV